MSHTVPKIADIEKKQLRGVPDFRVGDSVRVHFRIREGQKERVQVFTIQWKNLYNWHLHGIDKIPPIGGSCRLWSCRLWGYLKIR